MCVFRGKVHREFLIQFHELEKLLNLSFMVRQNFQKFVDLSNLFLYLTNLINRIPYSRLIPNAKTQATQFWLVIL